MFPYIYGTLDSFEVMFDKLKKFYDEIHLNKSIIKYKSIILLVRSYPTDYYSFDGISNHITEEVRMRTRVGKSECPYNIYLKIKDDIRYIQSTDKKEYIYSITKEANIYNPIIALESIYLFTDLYKKDNIKVLDPCAGWCDRLLSCFIAGFTEYNGYDTNDKLIQPYNKLLTKLKDYRDISKFSLIIAPFEHDSVLIEPEYYDLVLTSPPFFNYEIYEGELTSTNLYKTEREWYEKFYNILLNKCINGLKHNGYIMLYITPQMFNYTNIFLSKNNFKFINRLGFYQSNGNSENITKIPIIDSKIRYNYIWIKQ